MNFNNVCRTCLSTEELNPIFVETVDDKFCSSAIFVTTGIKVAIDDGLPQQMCARCISFSNASLKFRKQCKDAETRLLQVKQECDGAAETLNSGAVDSGDFDNKDMGIELKPAIDCKMDYDDVTVKSEAENVVEENGVVIYSPLNTTEEDPFQLKPAGGAGAAPERARARPGEGPSCNTSHHQQLQLRSCFIKLEHFPKEDLHHDLHTCVNCRMMFDCESSLRNHRCTGLCEKKATKVCDESAKISLRKQNTAKKPKTHICDVCSKEYSRKQQLFRHMRNIHKKNIGNITDKYICDVCGKRFYYLWQLTSHTQIHTRDKLFSCDHCKKEFTCKSNLTTHIRTHTGVKPYSCEVCKMHFRNSSHVNRHRQIHTGVKPFACNACDKRFGRRCHLTSHMRTHSGEKPFTCDVCQKQFSDSSNLTTHKLTHTGDRPHHCSVCQKQFTQKSSLDRHMNTHTGTGVSSSKTQRNRKSQ